MTRFYNAAEDFVDGNVEKGNGAKSAFIDPNRSLSYAALQAESYQCANLLKGAGVRREERIALILQDTVDYLPIFWGSLRSGIIPVCLNTLLSTEIYRYILEDCRASALFVSPALLPVVEPALEGLDDKPLVYVVGGDAGEYTDYAAARAAQNVKAETVQTLGDEAAFWLYSSGSTGMPKGVPHIHSSLRSTADTFGDQVLKLTADDLVYSAAKLFFAYGLGNAMTFPMAAGATTLLLPDRPTPDAVYGLLKAYNPTIFYGVPTLFSAMLAHPNAGREIGSANLRLCVSAGEALPEDVGKSWKALFGVDIVDGVGSTEMLHIFLSNTPDDIVYGTSGKAVPGYDLRLVDENGDAVADGEIGELLVRGGSSGMGYWNQREKSRKTFEGEWTRTGDKYILQNGRYVICGRTDDMFKVSGIWVSPFEVEAALISHDAVVEAAVVPMEDDEGLLKPKAYVILNQGHDASMLYEPLKEHVKSAIGAWKYPRSIEFVDDLPKTATGKIQRFKLRRS